MQLTNQLDSIILDHGTGGLLSQDLVTNVISPLLAERYLGIMEDSAILNLKSKEIAMTTDSFVVDPIFFKNGDIGKIAICGTVNDLAVAGAEPLYITLGIVIEEGFPLSDFRRILKSIYHAAVEANVYIVAGDTKVVNKGAIDKIFLNTSGIGIFHKVNSPISLNNIKANDDIIVTSKLGNHSIHIMSLREGLGYENSILSDCAPLNHMIFEVLKTANKSVHGMRDLTRGGFGSAVNEIASAINLGMDIEMSKLPIQHETKMAADMLGINPIYLANEGSLIIFCDPKLTNKILSILHKNRYGKDAIKVGKVVANHEKQVVGIETDGNEKIIDFLYGKELPRLC